VSDSGVMDPATCWGRQGATRDPRGCGLESRGNEVSRRPGGRPLDVLTNTKDVMPNPFKAHPDSIARRIEARQRKEAMQTLARAADRPEDDDGPNWLDITLDSSEEEVEAALARTSTSTGSTPGNTDPDAQSRRFVFSSMAASRAAAGGAAVRSALGKGTCRRRPCWMVARRCRWTT
jgi:hypothetical protein